MDRTYEGIRCFRRFIAIMFGGLCCASTSAGLSDYLWMVLSHGAAAAVDLLPFHSSSSSSCLLLQELFRFVVIRRRRRRLAETLLAVVVCIVARYGVAPPPLKYVPLNFPTSPHHLTYYTPAFWPPNFRPRCLFYMKWPIIAMASLLMHFSASATATLVQSANSPSFSHPTSFKMAVVIYLEEKRVEHMR